MSVDWLTAVGTAAIPVLLAALVSLLAWIARGAGKISRDQTGLGVQHAILAQSMRETVARIDDLVAKLNANFSIQINEQLFRNTLQEKVANLERQVAFVQRQLGALSPHGRRPRPEEDEVA